MLGHANRHSRSRKARLVKYTTQLACAIAALAFALSSCVAVQNGPREPANSDIIGQVTGGATDWKICKANRCFTQAVPTVPSGYGLKSGVLSIEFDVQGTEGGKSSHRLLGQLDEISRPQETGVISFALADGTLSGDITDQPVKITFVPFSNSADKSAYCVFSSGKYEAVNYIQNIFEISGGTALCFDSDGRQHRVENSRFEMPHPSS